MATNPTIYVAMLRGINVGGHKRITMADLRRAFAAAGCRDVETYIQSGNVVFAADEPDADALARAIERHLHGAFGYEIAVILRTAAEIGAVLRDDPFAGHDDPEAQPSITFFARDLPTELVVPRFSPRNDVEVVKQTTRELYTRSRRVNGRPGNPNLFGEQIFKTPATTRNLNTVAKLATLANAREV